MKNIIVATMALALFATPLAAGNSSSGVAQHERNAYGLDRNAPSVQVPVNASQTFVPASAGVQQFGLTSGINPAGAHLLRPHNSTPQWTPRDRHRPIHR